MFRNTVFYWHLWESLQLTARFFIFHQEIWSNIGKHNDPKRRKSPFAGGGLAPLFQEHFILIFWGWSEKALSLPTPKWPPWTLHLKMYYQKKFKQWCYIWSISLNLWSICIYASKTKSICEPFFDWIKITDFLIAKLTVFWPFFTPKKWSILL